MFKKLLLNYYNKKPKSEIQDYIKFIYQATFGGAHIAKNKELVKNYLYTECSQMPKEVNFYEPLYEMISDDYVRVNLRPYIKANFSLDNLIEVFSSSEYLKGTDELEKNINIFIEEVRNNNINLDINNVLEFIEKYRQEYYPVLHHTETYRNTYIPNYRVLPISFITDEMKYYQLKSFISYIKANNKKIFVAIEGKCTSGKTTLSNLLENDFDITLLHADDFFLNDKQKEKEIPIGEYIDQDRIDKLLTDIKTNNTVTYQKYDCTNKCYLDMVMEDVKDIVILEGVYSYNSLLSKHFNYLVFIHIDKDIQNNRLLKRSSPFIYNKFITEWIPRENEYFNYFEILEKSDIII